MHYSPKKQMILILLVVGSSFIGISLPYAIFTPMILNNIGGIVGHGVLGEFRVVLLGLLLCAYPIGQFFGASALGSLSDVVGRKPALIFSLVGTMLGYSCSAISVLFGSYFSLFISRFCTGFFEGNVAIAQSSAADMSSSLLKERTFSAINASIAIAYIVGPLLGAFLVWNYDNTLFGYSLPFFFATVLSLSLCLIVAFVFKETMRQDILSNNNSLFLNLKQHIFYGIKEVLEVLKMPSAKNAILIFLLFYASMDFFYEFYPLFFVGKWHFTPMQIGVFSAIYTLPYAISQIFLVPYISSRYDPMVILKFAAVVVGVMLIVLIVPNSSYSLFATLPILGVAISFCSTNTSILVSNSSHESMQGKVMGVSQALRVIGIALVTLIGGVIGTLGYFLPILLSAVVMFIALFLVFLRKNVNYGNVLA